jgi:hypothetical protein
VSGYALPRASRITGIDLDSLKILCCIVYYFEKEVRTMGEGVPTLLE